MAEAIFTVQNKNLMKHSFVYKAIDYIVQNLRHRNRCRFKYGAHASHGSTFEGMNLIGSGAKFRGRLGLGSYIGSNCKIAADIGRFTSVAPNVYCNPGMHPYEAPYASASPCFFSAKHNGGNTFATYDTFEAFRMYDPKRRIHVRIGNDCWIGEGVFCVGGISIGDGAVVLARAVVTKDVPPYAVVGGVPAKIIKYRYDAPTIRFLLESQWWNNSQQWFREHWELISNIDELKKYYQDKH